MTTPADGVGPFAVLLQRYRQAAGLSQEELAERAGLSARGISDLERGVRRSPYPATVRRLVEALSLDDAERATLVAAAQPCAPASGLARVEPTRSLPLPLSSFVGREREVAEMQRLLESSRLLTLTGAGGVGKTRLALTAAREWMTKDREAGALVAFVDLAPLADPGLVPQTVAAQFGLPEQPDRPVLATLVEALQGQAGLLILDNCEHLIQACAALVQELLTACPDLRVLATSREPLLTAGEKVWRVPSLELPEPSHDLVKIASAEAVRLFVERAQAADSSFQFTEQNACAVAEVCRRLDGIPLALELAAARVSLLSIEQIAARLDNALGLLVAGPRLAPARQQTVRATLDWSYALLTELEQVLFERLSVFAGGWTLEAAEVVAGGDGLPAREVLALLGRLVNASMVVVEPGPAGQVRYRLLETVRQYAAERLARLGASGELIRRRHALAYTLLAEAAEPKIFAPPERAAWVARLTQDWGNLRAALAWSIQNREADLSCRLAGALPYFWHMRGTVHEGRDWAEQAVRCAGAADRSAGRARALFAAGTLAFKLGETVLARQRLEECASVYQELQDEVGLARARMHLGIVLAPEDRAAARGLQERALAVFRRVGDSLWTALALLGLGNSAMARGDLDTARSLFEESHGLYQTMGDGTMAAEALNALGDVARAVGDDERAASLYRESLMLLRYEGGGVGVPGVLHNLGRMAQRRRHYREALAYFSEALALFRASGDQRGLAECLAGVATVALAVGQSRRAVLLLGAGDGLLQAAGAVTSPSNRDEDERTRAAAAARLGRTAFAAVWNEGHAMPIDRALAYASATIDSVGDTTLRARPEVDSGPELLTRREREVASMLGRRLSNRQLAAELGITEQTVETHLKRILGKLGLASRHQVPEWLERRRHQ